MNNEIKAKYILYFTLIGSAAAIIFGYFNIISPGSFVILGIIEVIIGILSLFNILILRKYKNTDLSASILLFLMYMFVAILTITGGIAYTGIVWVFTFPVLSFGLKHSRKAIYWVGGLFIVVYLSWSISLLSPGSVSPYQWPQIRQVTAALLVVTALMYVYKRLQEKTEDIVQSQLADIQKYKQAVENSSDIIVISDNEGKIIYANQSVHRVTGYEPSAVIGQKAGKPWGGQMDQQTYKQLWKTISVEKKSFEGEMRNKRLDGHEYDAHLHIDPILDENQNVLFYVGIERDITKLKEDERLREEFLSFASHQLRTPLSAVQWLNQILADGTAGPITDQQKTILSKMNLALNNMNSSIRDFLDVNRTETGKYKLHSKEINLTKLIEEIMVSNEPMISHKNIKVNLHLEESSSLFIHDEEAIKNIIANLLSNSLKYSYENSTIELTTGVKNEVLTISCVDKGIGIPADELKSIGKKFYRANNATLKEVNGTGVGLFLLNKIVELSSGSWNINSVENIGTTVQCILPQLKQD